MHIYQSPFYYIDYCLAQTVSLQIWALMQKDRANAWDHYMAYTRQGGSRVFTELLKNADLVSPFEESWPARRLRDRQGLAGPLRPDGAGNNGGPQKEARLSGRL